MIYKLLLFTIGVMKLVDMFPLGWNGLNTMQVQILPPIYNKQVFIFYGLVFLKKNSYINYIYVVD
jgi:hypothetical protein